MPRAVRRIAFSSLLSIVCTGCGTVRPNSTVSADASISASDLREIERLLPVVGVRRPISDVSRVGPDKYSVICRGRDLNESAFEYFSFTVYHKRGRWVADKSSISRGEGVIVE
jgi:hypothetical protein